MINRETLKRIIGDLERGVEIAPFEIQLLREAVELLEELAGTVDKIITKPQYKERYEREETQPIKIIKPGTVWPDKV